MIGFDRDFESLAGTLDWISNRSYSNFSNAVVLVKNSAALRMYAYLVTNIDW